MAEARPSRRDPDLRTRVGSYRRPASRCSRPTKRSRPGRWIFAHDLGICRLRLFDSFISIAGIVVLLRNPNPGSPAHPTIGTAPSLSSMSDKRLVSGIENLCGSRGEIRYPLFR